MVHTAGMDKEHLIAEERRIIGKIQARARALRANDPSLLKSKALEMALTQLPRTYEAYLETRRLLAMLNVPPIRWTD
jgi:hypothetical protein